MVFGKSCLQSLLTKISNLTYFSGILIHILHRLVCDFIIWPNKRTKSFPIKAQIIVSIDVQRKGQLNVHFVPNEYCVTFRYATLDHFIACTIIWPINGQWLVLACIKITLS